MLATRYRGLILVGALWLCAGVIVGAAEQSEAETRGLQAAHGLLNRGLHELAAAEYRAYLETKPMGPDAAEARYGLGVCMLTLGKVAEADATLAEIPADAAFEFAAEALALRGQCRLLLGDHARAGRLLDSFAKRYAGHALAADVAALRVEAHYRAGEHRETARLAENFAKRWPENARAERVAALRVFALAGAEAWGDVATVGEAFAARYGAATARSRVALLVGLAHFRKGAYEAAERAFTRAEAGTPEAAEAAYWLAKCSLRRGTDAVAAKRFASLLETYPDHPMRAEAQYDRAIALLRADADTKRVISALREFVEQQGGHNLEPDALRLLVRLQRGRGAYAESSAWCERFLAAHGGHEGTDEVAFLRAENAFDAGHFTEAAEAYRAYLLRATDEERKRLATLRLGLSLLRVEQTDEAIEPLTRAASWADEDGVFVPALEALGRVYFRRNSWTKAREYLGAFLERRPDVEDGDALWLALGLAAKHSDDHAGAIAACEELLRRHPESAHRGQALFEQGQTWQVLGDTGDASLAFERLVEEASDSEYAPYARRRLAEMAQEAGDDARAAALYDELLAKHAEHPAAREAGARRVLALARLNQPNEVLEQADAITSGELAALPEDLRRAVLYEKGWALRSLGRTNAAAQEFRAVLEQPAGDETLHALLELAEIAAANEHCDDAARLLARLFESAGSKPRHERLVSLAHYRAGACAAQRGENGPAAKHLQAYVERPADTAVLPMARLLLGRALSELGRDREAVKHLAAALDALGEAELRAAAMLQLADSLVAIQHWQRAAETYQRFTGTFAQHAHSCRAQFGLGWCLENQGRRDEATAAYRKVIEGGDSEYAARAQFQIGECLFAEKKYEAAARALLTVDIVYTYPQWSAAALYEAGRCFEHLNKPAEAKQQFEAVRARYPKTRWAELAGKRLEAPARQTLPGRAMKTKRGWWSLVFA